MIFHYSFTIKNNFLGFTRITNLISRVKCEIVEFKVKENESTGHFSVETYLRGERRMLVQFTRILQNTVNVTNLIASPIESSEDAHEQVMEEFQSIL